MADPKPPAPQQAKAPQPQKAPAPGKRDGKPVPATVPAPSDGEQMAAAAVTSAVEAPPGRLSKLYLAAANIAYLGLLGFFLGMVGMTALALDFLDLVQWRYRIPEAWRAKWPVSAYFEFVKLHQLPDEQRYQELLQREKQRYDQIIGSGSVDLQRRADSLEASYRDLVRSQEEMFRKRQEELRVQQEELVKERKALEDLKADIAARKDSIDLITRQLASEAASLESSMIRFMEEENRLRPVQDIAATMDPRSMARILDEVSDNALIYQILKGIPPEQSSLVLASMDPEKAGKIMKISQNPPVLPQGGPDRSYIPQSLQNLIATTQANLR
ncbi:MAG TPA: hypothetical protein PLP29_11865 [Candidatus Ozemobacteraceae bacterium]|nr:hypothetical protein [Candidatus Ozemobacteraceae bacterium]